MQSYFFQKTMVMQTVIDYKIMDNFPKWTETVLRNQEFTKAKVSTTSIL